MITTQNIPDVFYDETELRTTTHWHRCLVCFQTVGPQLMRALFENKQVVGWACMNHPVPEKRLRSEQGSCGGVVLIAALVIAAIIGLAAGAALYFYGDEIAAWLNFQLWWLAYGPK